MEILTLGEKIKSKRKDKNMTLKDLAGDRITPGQISLVESGKSKPSIDLLQYLADKLETEIDYFLESEEKQAARVCEFYSNIAESELSDGNFVRTGEALEKGMHYAQKYNLLYFKGKFDFIYANLKLINNELEEAQQHCLSANSAFLKLESVDDVVRSFVLLGRITLKMGYVSTALNYFMQGDNILNEYNHVNEFLKAQIFYFIAYCNSSNGNIQQSIEFALLAKDRLNVINNRREYAQTIILLAISYGKENNIKEALKYAKQAKKLFNEINDIKEIAIIESNLGMIFSKADNFEASFAHLENAIKLKKEIMDNTIYETMLGMCENYIKIGDLDKAIETVNQIMNEINDDQHNYRIKCYEYLFKIYEKKGDKKKAEEILLFAIRYLEPLDYKRELAEFYIMLGKFYIGLSEEDMALNFITKGLNLYSELGVIPK